MSSDFRQLDAYQLSVAVRQAVIAATADARVRADGSFTQQIRDAARGAPRNIAEGFSRFNPAEFRRFLSYAKASLDETANHVEDGYESGYFSGSVRDDLTSQISRSLAAITALMRYLESPQAVQTYRRLLARRQVSAATSRRRREER